MSDKIIGTIKAVYSKKILEGQIGFITEEEEKWYNVEGDADTLKIALTTIFPKGSVVEFSLQGDTNIVEEIKQITAPKKEYKAPEKKGFNGEDMIGLEELLSAAHKKAKDENQYFSTLLNIEEIDNATKSIRVKAILIVTDKESGKELFRHEDYGDAENIKSEEVKKAWLRQAVTRAKVRVLRFYTNNAATAKEEVE